MTRCSCKTRGITLKEIVLKLCPILTEEYQYSEIPIIRPPTVLVKSGLDSEQVSLMRPIFIENFILVLKQVVLIARVVLILSGLNSGTSLYLGGIKKIVIYK